jgi:hypothetical protein
LRALRAQREIKKETSGWLMGKVSQPQLKKLLIVSSRAKDDGQKLLG